jgi:hypothetical protein
LAIGTPSGLGKRQHFFAAAFSLLRFGTAPTSVYSVKVLLVIPMLHYKMLLGKSAVLWPEYRALKNGIIDRNVDGSEMVQILCSSEQAKMIFNFARRVCSEAIPYIQQITDWLT